MQSILQDRVAREISSTIAAKAKGIDQATRFAGSASIADRQSSDQVTQLASTRLALKSWKSLKQFHIMSSSSKSAEELGP